MKRTFGLLAAALIVFVFSLQAHATLILKGTGTSAYGTYNLIYDDDLDITWYDYSHVANPWADAVSWASGLTVDFGGTIYDDWRLPTVTDIGNDGCNFGYSGTDCGYNVDTSTGEMAHLFYDELGNLSHYDTSGGPQPGWSPTINTGPFNNLEVVSQAGLHWSGTEYAPDTSNVWVFYFDSGSQDYTYKYDNNPYALAVRPGDVSAGGGPAPIPEPSTWLLLGSGLAGLAAFRKRLGRIHR